MKAISNTRYREDGRTVWRMERLAGGVPHGQFFMYTHQMLEDAVNGRQHAAQGLRRARAELRRATCRKLTTIAP